MSLTRLFLAALLVAALFNLYDWLLARTLLGRGSTQVPDELHLPETRRSPVRTAAAASAEAVVLTLLAALWFGSLGHGGWVTLFALLGLLVEGTTRWRRMVQFVSARRFEIVSGALGVLRYVAAGGLLAWRLG